MVGAYGNRENGWMKGMQMLFAILLLLSFFLPWVSWDGAPVSGYALPWGSFFSTSERVGGPADPFPQFRLALLIFWLVPALAIFAILFLLLKKKAATISFVAATLALSMVTVFFLFTKTLVVLGVGNSLVAMLKPGLYLQAFAAAGMVLTAFPVKNRIVKPAWLLAGPVLAFVAYNAGEHYIMNETHVATEHVKTDFTMTATDLLKEFAANDTLANKKYLDKTLVVKGTASEVNVLADSTSTIQFKDSSGSYLIFSLEKNDMEQVKNINVGEKVSIKGVCSGSIFSEILGTTSVTFKRATLK